MVNLEKHGNVYTLTFEEADGNALTLELLNDIHAAFDKVIEDSKGPCALVLTATGKSFSSGLSIRAMSAYKAHELTQFSDAMQRLYGRLINFPVPTVAAINGHAFAGGAFLALACDYRVMREDKGWFCISEVDVGVAIAPNIMEVAILKMAPNVLRDAVLTGKRYSGQACLELGLADAVCSEATLLDMALEIVKPIATKKRHIYKALKSSLYAPCAKGLGV